jgi:hypothetical protein
MVMEPVRVVAVMWYLGGGVVLELHDGGDGTID